MAEQAEGADVFKIALPAALDDRDDVIGIPKRPAEAAFQPPMLKQLQAMRAAGALKFGEGGAGVDPAQGADAAVAQENLLA